MIEFQSCLYDDPINIEEVKEVISKLETRFTHKEIDHELLSAMEIEYDLIPILCPLLHTKHVKINFLHNRDQLFLFKLYKAGKIRAKDIQYQIPHIYLKTESEFHLGAKDNGSSPLLPDFDIQRNNHFGGDLADIISRDAVEDLTQKVESTPDFNVNQYLRMHDQLIHYTAIPLLLFSAQKGAVKCYKYLIQKGADINLTSVDWNSVISLNCLDFAVIGGKVGIFIDVESRGLKVDADTAALASKFHQNYMLETILDNRQFRGQKFTLPLFSAVKWNNIAAFKIFISMEGWAECDEKGRTLLHVAARRGHMELVRELLTSAQGGTVNKKDQDGNTPLHLAALYNQPLTIELLLQAGADVFTPNFSGNLPIHLAATYSTVEVLKILCNIEGFNVNVRGFGGKTPFQMASRNRNTKCLQYLTKLKESAASQAQHD